ncbi:GTPase Era [Thiotrichales bacterium 19S3-7]|nr:GTPase Era [Thiotrichales bacterium 19S3-7]MCF6800773.1 GTPase Era [Thiotrichales bacterium 19S3-11]
MNTEIETTSTYCGYVAIIGRPNVGKSTILNRILQQKISITSRKPQTTRHQILGVKTDANKQIIYVDTPGLHQKEKKALNRYMNKAAFQSIKDVDVVVFVVEALKWTELEVWILDHLEKLTMPVILVVNKVDVVKNKEELLPFVDQVTKNYPFASVIPLSAKSGKSINVLEQEIEKYIPEGEFHFEKDQITDRPVRFLISEIIREKLMRSLGQEVPYQLTVEIEHFKQDEHRNIIDISASIIVERKSQKVMIIGKQGQKLKKIGSQARLDIERLLDSKVYLQLWVKVKEGWSENDSSLKSYGYKLY